MNGPGTVTLSGRPLLESAQDDAVRLVLQDLERVGLDVVTDGEVRRESYFNRFATALDGVDLDRPGINLNRRGRETPVPRVVGPLRRRRPVELEALRFAQTHTSPAKRQTRCMRTRGGASERRTSWSTSQGGCG